jgi:hypothetical protein
MIKHAQLVRLVRASNITAFVAAIAANALNSINCSAQSVASIETNKSAGQVIAYCDPANRRQVIAEIRWTLDSAPMAPSAARTAVQAEKLSATTIDDGFERDLAVDLIPFTSGAPQARPSAARISPASLPGLEKLSLAGTYTTKIAPQHSAALRMAANPAKEQFTFVVKGLQSGMRYYWSLDQGHGAPLVATVLAPVCAVDRANR